RLRETVKDVQTFDELLAAWSAAEARGDPAALDPLLDDDFRGDGARGRVLDKARWLACHARGELSAASLAWTDARLVDETALAVGTLTWPALGEGRSAGAAFACTVVAVRRGGRWRIVNVQLGRTD